MVFACELVNEREGGRLMHMHVCWSRAFFYNPSGIDLE
jgi:hypothetical protein